MSLSFHAGKCSMLPSPALKPSIVPPSIAAGVVLAALKAYKFLISPLFTGCCRYYPSCADYTREAVLVHGVARGLWLGGRRLARCHPLGGHGVDPVPTADRSRPLDG
jgi:hypothetical protein